MLALATSLLSADAPSGGPPQWQVHLQSALQAHQSGDLSAAAPLYKAALDGHAPLRQSWQVLNNYGLSIQSEDPEAAAASFREVLALPGQHENADAHFNLGNALSDTAAHAEAVEAYGAAAKLAPDDGEFAAAHGGALLQLSLIHI